jgi:hypothetical protein
MTLIIGLSISLLANVVFGFLLVRASRRLFRFDDLYELLVHDIDTNIKYFDKLTETSVFSNAPEILDAQRNMSIMRTRLNEYVLSMEDLTGRELRKRFDAPNPPVVA